MSYCVNCGVKLDDSAKKCALCSTPVINPNIVIQENHEKPFPDKVQLPKSVNRRFVAYIITMIMLIPNMILFLVNVFFFRDAHWSIYISTATLLVWTLFVFPFYTKRLRPFLLWGVDTAAVSAYSYVLVKIGTDKDWMLRCVFSVIFLMSLALLILIKWLRYRKRQWTAIMVHVIVDCTVVSFLSGALVGVFSGNINFFIAGIIVSVCCAALVGFFVYCDRSRHVRGWLNKTFYM